MKPLIIRAETPQEAVREVRLFIEERMDAAQTRKDAGNNERDRLRADSVWGELAQIRIILLAAKVQKS